MSTATLHIEIEKILIPKLRFQGFEGEWEKKKLGDVGKIRMCKRVFSDETSESGEIPFYKIGTFGKEADAYITNELYFNYRERFSFPKIGEILMSASGTLGRTVVYDGKPAYFQDSNIVWIDNNEKLITNSFLYYIYQIVKYDSEGGTIQRLYNSIISNTKFNRPTLPEQQKTASFLSAVDEKIQQLSRKKELLSQYKKGVMQQLFSGKLRFKNENGEDYADWEEKKLGEIARITTGSSNRQDSNLDGDYTFFDRSQDIRSSNIFLFDTEAIIVPGEGQEFIPKYFIGKFDLHQRTYAVMDFGVNMGKFLFFYIGYHSNHLNSHAVGSTVKSLRLPMFEKMPIKLPSLPEQQKIANFLSSIDSKIESTSQQINQTQSFKKGLLQQMFV